MKKAAIVFASVLVVACASSPKTDVSQSSGKNIPNTTDSKPALASQNPAPISAAEMELNKLAATIQHLDNQSDYFDYNKSSIKPEYLSVIQQEAAFIKEHTQDVVTLEGNADERGTDEYNLALGSRRAIAVKKSLEKMGVSAQQLKIVSFGKQKAKLTCHEEKCWKENRRVDFVHKLS
jgi:peptidoglycan-associated lipoprotein